MKFANKKFFKAINIFLLLVFIMTTGFGCKGSDGAVPAEKLKNFELNYWRSYDDEDAFEDIINAYHKLHPNINVNYRKFRSDEYEKALLEAMAEDRGPDVFSIPQSWVRKYQNKLEPMPVVINMPVQEVQGTINKKLVYVNKKTDAPTLRKIQATFPDIVSDNAIIDGKVYGFPLSLENLVLIYNKDLFNLAGLTKAPTTWEEFQNAVKKLTKFSGSNNIIQSGVAMGTGANTNYSADILSVIMMQAGTEMTDTTKWFRSVYKNNKETSPGKEGLQYYTDFASPLKDIYSWNLDLGNSQEAFIAGRVGMMFSYNYNLPTIRSQAPKMNLGVAPIPQINPDLSVNYAEYFLEVVSKKSKNKEAAWDFVLFATQGQNSKQKFHVESYLEKTARPTAIKALINQQMEDPDLNAAVTQSLTAKNWYRGYDPEAAKAAIRILIDQYAKSVNDRDLATARENAIQKIDQSLEPSL